MQAMDKWLIELDRLSCNQQPLVMVTVASVKGSTPREPGAKMLVTEQQIFSTIGGGNLEYQAIQIARNMLAHHSPHVLQRFSLGAGLGQCCGGVVSLLFECIQQREPWIDQLLDYQQQGQPCVQVIPLAGDKVQARYIVAENSPGDSVPDRFARQLLQPQGSCQIKSFENIVTGQSYVFDPVTVGDFHVYVFGAGHVGRALVDHLSLQELHITWVDTRDDQFPEVLPDNVVSCCTDTPESIIDGAAAGSYFVVMTHDHQLDQHLCEQILKRDDFNYLGLIGSMTKRRKFEHRMQHRGITAESLRRMTCPIGISGISSKKPAAIGLAVSAQIAQIYQQAQLLQQVAPAPEQQLKV
jgi:xanthine dehydrogenase accessory factor